MFFFPSYISGIGGMHCEHICAVYSWRKGPPQHDCIFVETDLNSPGILGLDIAHVQLLFSFTHNNVKYFCALVHWFSCMSESVDSSTGMWVVEHEVTNDGRPIASVIHLDTIFRAAHLLPVFKEGFVSKYLSCTDTLDKFQMFYVNKFVDHHAFEIAFETGVPEGAFIVLALCLGGLPTGFLV